MEGPLIVLAEDDSALRALLATALDHDGCRVVLVDSVSSLVAAVSLPSERPQLVIADVTSRDGHHASEALRAAGYSGPLIVMASYRDGPTRVRAEALGAEVIDKPLGLATVRSAVQRALAG